MTENPQVDRSHYSFAKYGFEERFVSYYWQLKEVLTLNPDSILEIGVGDKVFGNFIKDNTGVAYQSLDFAEDLSPDIVGSVTAIPLGENAVDVACAFEVLEHLPFEQFEGALQELSRVAKRYVVISLPHFGPTIAMSIKIPFLPLLRFSLKLPFPKKHVFNGQHHWEIGKQGYPASLIRKKLAVHGTILRDFVPFLSPYHHFFILRLQKKSTL